MQILAQMIRDADYRYYVKNDPIMSDTAYDAAFQKLKALESEHPEWADPCSPTQRVGSDLAYKAKSHHHPHPMLSVQSFYSPDEIAIWIKKLPAPHPTFSLEQKLDGVSVELHYLKGKLHRALSRGDGLKGQDITHTIKTVKNIPLQLMGNHDVTVRGEVVITKANMEKVNRVRKKQGQSPYSNTRSAAASMIMNKTSLWASMARLEGVMYQVFEMASQKDMFSWLTINLFSIPLHVSGVTGVTLKGAIKSFACNDWPTDGLVVKIEQTGLRQQLGQGSRHVNWAVALKQQSGAMQSPFRMIDYSLSTSGLISPVIHFYPVTYQGITYSSARVSFEFLKQNPVSPGQVVHFMVKGGVAAQITHISGQAFAIVPTATHCPCCKHPLDTDQKAVYCTNPLCPDKTGAYGYLSQVKGVKVFDQGVEFGKIAEMRYAALTTMAMVPRRQKSSVIPLILYTANGQLDRIMYMAGLIHSN